jgi:MFS family permease
MAEHEMTNDGPGVVALPDQGRLAQFKEGLGPSGLVALLVLAGLGAAQNFDSAAFGVLAPEIRHTFGLNNAGIDTVAGLTGALPLLGSVVIGSLGDRGDRVRIARRSALLWGVTAILTGLAPVLAVLVVARLLGGIGLLSSQTIYPSLLSDYYSVEQRAQVFTVFLLASTGIGLVASPLAGLMGDALGWRSTFVLLALPTFFFVLLLRRLHEPARRPSRQPADPATASLGDADPGPVPPPVGTMRESFRIIRASRTIRRVWMGAFILGGASAPLSTLVSTFFKDVYHVGSFGRGAIVSLIGLGGVIGLLGSGAMAQRMLAARRGGTLPVIAGLAAVVFAVFVLGFAVAPVLWLAVTAAGLAGIGLGGFLPPYTTIVSMVTPSHLRSQAYAWSTVWFALGAIAVSVFVGTLADADGQRAALAALAGVLAVGGAVLMSARRYVDDEMTESPEVGSGLPGLLA